jgi:hypothetical protein
MRKQLQHESFDAHNNDTIKHIEAKTIDLPIVVEPIEAKTSYKHCIDYIGASISLVYAKNWQNILHVLVKPETLFNRSKPFSCSQPRTKFISSHLNSSIVIDAILDSAHMFN